MRLLKKQKMYRLVVHHNATLQGSFIWWILNKNKRCHKFCPNCEYYFRCQEDIALENLMEGK